MKILKSIVLIIIMIACCWTMQAEEKDKLPHWLTLDDLTDPKSPSYVPYPFPKTKEEIIKNLNAQLERMFSNENSWEVELGDAINILPGVLKENSGVKIEKIVKIKNRIAAFPSGYSYLVIILDTKRQLRARVSMRACGLISGGKDPSKRDPGKKIKSEREIIKMVAKYNKVASKRENIKKIELVAHDILFSTPQSPAFEITMIDGSTYIVNYRDRVFKKTMEKEIVGKKHSFYKNERHKLGNDKAKFKRGDRVFMDEKKNKIIYLKRLTDEDIN